MNAQSGLDLLGTLAPGASPFPAAHTVLPGRSGHRAPAAEPAPAQRAASPGEAPGGTLPGHRTGGPRRASHQRHRPVHDRTPVRHRGIVEPGLALALSAAAALAGLLPRLLPGSLPATDVSGSVAVDVIPMLARPWATAALPWLPAAVAVMVALAAVAYPGRAPAPTVRAAVLLAAAAAMAVLTPAQIPLSVLWVVAVAAVYPSFVPAGAARLLTTLAVAAPAVPLVTHAVRGAGSDPAGSLLQDVDPATTAGTIALLGAMAVAGVLGACATANRRNLESQTTLAVRRREDAERAALQLDRMSAEDQFTGLPNRAGLLRRMMLLLARADAVGGQVGLLVVEVDRFAALTDSFGTGAADEVVRQVARRLRAWHPAADEVARIGEHRFAVLVDGAGADTCAGLARRITELLDDAIVTGHRELSITCSIGIALSGPDLDTAEELLRAAEEAMHAVQRGGHSRWATFDRAMRAHTLTQAGLELELRDAVREGRIGVAFQPVMALHRDGDDEGPVAVEAVPRWTRQDGTAVPPPRFLAMAEDLGLGGSLGLQVLDTALGAMARWRDGDSGVRQVWVNMLGSQLLDPEFPHMVSAQLVAHGLAPSCLQLEINAPTFVDSEQARSTLGMLRSLGIHVALENFGRDGTSLAALRHLPVTVVKLDHQLSADLGRNEAILQGIVEMCRRLGLRTVLDGVETNVQLQAARRIGADAVQGSILGRPTSAEDLEALLAVP